jgi:hypothetical protein
MALSVNSVTPVRAEFTEYAISQNVRLLGQTQSKRPRQAYSVHSVKGWPEPYIYSVYIWYFWQETTKYVRSYTEYIYGPGQPYSFCVCVGRKCGCRRWCGYGCACTHWCGCFKCMTEPNLITRTFAKVILVNLAHARCAHVAGVCGRLCVCIPSFLLQRKGYLFPSTSQRALRQAITNRPLHPLIRSTAHT